MSDKFFVTKTFNPGKGYPCVFRQWRAESHCRFWHGYDLIFAVTFDCEPHYLTPEGWVIDFGSLKYLKEILDATFDHKTVVAEDDPALDFAKEAARQGLIDLVILPGVGIEAFSYWWAQECQKQLDILDRQYVVGVRNVTVFEHLANAAGYIPGV